jgi:hypothetical protein
MSLGVNWGVRFVIHVMQMRPQEHKGLLPDMNGHSQQPRPAVRASTDVSISLRIADLRREIEGIQEQNEIYRFQKRHGHQGQVANERRKIRLEEIMQQLAALRPRRDLP